MKGFFHLLTTSQVRDMLRSFPRLDAEETSLDEALGRVCASDIIAPEDLPPHARSTMDGFAVRAKDVFGASESEPALIKVVGEVRMGEPPRQLTVGSGEAVRIWTGGFLPEGTDGVVMLEYTNEIEPGLIEIYRPIAPHENVILPGEDCRLDRVCLKRGTRLRPQELGLLAGLGVTTVHVVKRPRVFILSTGDEIVPETETPPFGKIRDINSTTLSALVTMSGASPEKIGVVEDSFEAITTACQQALKAGADIVLVSGGSSVGNRDFTVKVFKHVTGTDVLVHGVAIRPGKPTILARLGDSALFGLPGHAASCMVVYLIFVHFLINVFQGLPPETGLELRRVKCGQVFPSVTGREDYVRVVVDPETNTATPVYGKSGLISTLVKAHGLLVIPRDSEGFHEGEDAEVLLLP